MFANKLKCQYRNFGHNGSANMDIVEIWNSIGYFDGILFTIWLGILYYGKCWIDSRFK